MSNPLFTLYAELNPDESFDGDSVNQWAYDLIQQCRIKNSKLIEALVKSNSDVESLLVILHRNATCKKCKAIAQNDKT